MKVNLKKINNFFSKTQIEGLKDFIKFLNQELPLSHDVNIFFEKARVKPMTTGTRLSKHNIHILAEDRLLIDIMRTLAHEWVHEFQHQKMGLKDTEPIQDIGGPEENMANVLAGIFLKAFVKKFPHHEKVLYHEDEY